MWASKNKVPLAKAGAVLLALCLWQTAAMILSKPLLLPSPADVIQALGSVVGLSSFWKTVWFSFSRILIGFLAGLLLGSGLAVLAARFSAVEILLWPYMVTVRTVPVASFVVIALIWISSATLSVFISFLIVLPIIYQNVLSGLNSIDPRMVEMADVYGIPFRRRLLLVYLPVIKPFLLSGATVSAGLAWKSGVAAEIIGVPKHSIGEMLYDAKVFFDTPGMLAWTVVIIVLSVLFEKTFLVLLRRAIAALEKLS